MMGNGVRHDGLVREDTCRQGIVLVALELMLLLYLCLVKNLFLLVVL